MLLLVWLCGVYRLYTHMITSSAMNTFTLIFILALGASLGTQLWLTRRQMRHVASHRSAVPPAFAGKIPLAAHEKAADYTLAHGRLDLVSTVWGTLLLLGWTLGGGLALLDSMVTDTGLSPVWHGVVFLLALMMLGALLELPFSIYQTFNIEQRFGFNKMTPTLFVVDLIKSIGLIIVIGAPLLYAVMWLMLQMGELWWLYVWTLWAGFNLVANWAYPVVIAPIFNKFTALEEGNTRTRIEALLARTGFKSNGIYVMDGSKRSGHGNAYFAGFGKSKRIVFFDTLLKSLNDDEIEAVLAHELGHFKRKHITKRIVMIFALSLASLALLGLLIKAPWFFAGMNATPASTHMALALFALVMPVFTFFLSPLMAWGSRKHEFEADDFAAKEASADKLIDALVKMYEENAKTVTPDPIHSAFYDSHPPAPVRIAHLEAQT